MQPHLAADLAVTLPDDRPGMPGESDRIGQRCWHQHRRLHRNERCRPHADDGPGGNPPVFEPRGISCRPGAAGGDRAGGRRARRCGACVSACRRCAHQRALHLPRHEAIVSSSRRTSRMRFSLPSRAVPSVRLSWPARSRGQPDDCRAEHADAQPDQIASTLCVP